MRKYVVGVRYQTGERKDGSGSYELPPVALILEPIGQANTKSFVLRSYGSTVMECRLQDLAVFNSFNGLPENGAFYDLELSMGRGRGGEPALIITSAVPASSASALASSSPAASDKKSSLADRLGLSA